MILGLLLGNTSLRFCLFEVQESDSLRSCGHIAWDELVAQQGELIDAIDGELVEAVVVGSVRDDRLPQVCSLLPPTLPAPILARRDFPLAIENRYENPEEVGTDRLLNAMAVVDRSYERGAVVIDFGTAVSFSVVSSDGAFLGGPIAVGIPSLIAGLSVSAPRLPRPVLSRPERTLTRSTRDAVGAGVYWQVVGGVAAILTALLEELPFDDPHVFATGGDAPWLAAAIPEIEAVLPHLTLEGLAIAYRSACSSTPRKVRRSEGGSA